MKEGWTTRKFSDIFDLQMGKTPSRDNSSYWGGTNTWVSIADMNCGKYIYDTKEHITNSAVSESGIYRVSKDTVIMSFKLSIGKTAIATKDLYTNEAIMSFNTKEGFEILPDYIYYYLKGYKWQGMNKAVMGMTLNKKAISNNIFSYPNTLQQQHIVEELDLLSSIIEKKNAQLNELDNLAQSLFYEMFGDPITNERKWNTLPLGQLSNMVRGPFGSALKKEFFVPQSKDTYKVYEQKHAIQKDDKIGDYYISKEKFEELRRFEVFSGDIIMSCSGTIGEFFEIPQGACRGVMNQALLKFKLNEALINKDYFLFVMQYVKKNFTVHGSGLQNIGSVKVIKSVRIGVPSLDLQSCFSQRLRAINETKILIKKSIEEVETLFNSRMDYYFN